VGGRVRYRIAETIGNPASLGYAYGAVTAHRRKAERAQPVHVHCGPVTGPALDTIPAVVHANGTARVQTLGKPISGTRRWLWTASPPAGSTAAGG